MPRYVIGNWKCHKTSDDGRRWFAGFAALYRPHREVRVIVAPTLVSLESMASHLAGLGLAGVSLAAQDISPFPKGSYTGAVAADMVAKIAGFVIIGHSERRRYFHETSQDVINKAGEAADSGLTPIVCVEGVESLLPLAALADIDCRQLLLAYTPVDALNFSLAESPAKVAEAAGRIRQFLPACRVVYGGALTPANVRDYLALPGLAGVFVGASSLEPEPFADICNQAASLVG